MAYGLSLTASHCPQAVNPMERVYLSSCARLQTLSRSGLVRPNDNSVSSLTKRETSSHLLFSSTKSMGSPLFVHRSRVKFIHRSHRHSWLSWTVWTDVVRWLTLVQRIGLMLLTLRFENLRDSIESSTSRYRTLRLGRRFWRPIRENGEAGTRRRRRRRFRSSRRSSGELE